MDNSNNVAVTTTSDTKMDVDANSPAKEASNIQLTTSTKTLERSNAKKKNLRKNQMKRVRRFQ